MRIISLEPFLTEIVCHFDMLESLVGVSHMCDFPEQVRNLPRVTTTGSSRLARYGVDLDLIRDIAPDVVLTCYSGRDDDGARGRAIRAEIEPYLPPSAKVLACNPHTLEQVFDTITAVGQILGAGKQGAALAQKLKAQSMDWCDSFYERMKNKKVTFLSGVKPFTLAGAWVADMIVLASAHSQAYSGVEEHDPVKWEDIVNYRPDVIVVAPQGMSVGDSAAVFKDLEKLPGWENIPAVKRGEVIFAPGNGFFYRPGPRLIPSMGILVSAIAGLESGYITERDSFYRLRWLELQRHRF